jgi:hypothetical protein
MIILLVLLLILLVASLGFAERLLRIVGLVAVRVHPRTGRAGPKTSLMPVVNSVVDRQRGVGTDQEPE